MIDFKQEINKYKSIRTTEDVSGNVTNDMQDILDLLKQVSRPTVVKSTNTAPKATANPATRTVTTKPIASIVPKVVPVPAPVTTDTADINMTEESTNTVDQQAKTGGVD